MIIADQRLKQVDQQRGITNITILNFVKLIQTTFLFQYVRDHHLLMKIS